MKKWVVLWSFLVFMTMIGIPYLSVLLKSDTGLGIVLILFFLIDPFISVVSGILAGFFMKKLWYLSILTPLLYLIGTWLIFDFGNTDFLFYFVFYLFLSVFAMLATFLIKKYCYRNKGQRT